MNIMNEYTFGGFIDELEKSSMSDSTKKGLTLGGIGLAAGAGLTYGLTRGKGKGLFRLFGKKLKSAKSVMNAGGAGGGAGGIAAWKYRNLAEKASNKTKSAVNIGGKTARNVDLTGGGGKTILETVKKTPKRNIRSTPLGGGSVKNVVPNTPPTPTIGGRLKNVYRETKGKLTQLKNNVTAKRHAKKLQESSTFASFRS